MSLIFIAHFYLYLGRKEIWNLVYETTKRQIHGFAQAFSARLTQLHDDRASWQRCLEGFFIAYMDYVIVFD